MFDTFHIQCIGANHIEKEMICQDSVSSATQESYCLAVVADGHGGTDYVRSDRGSRYAIEAAQECIEEFMRHRSYFENSLSEDYPRLLRQLARSIVASWNDKVMLDIDIEAFSEDELSCVSEKAKQRYISGQNAEQAYGTTLITAIVSDNYWFGLQQGDGKCIAVGKDGSIYEPIPWDDRCYQNICTSMCDSDVGNSIRFYFSKEVPLAVFVASDGIDDSFAYDIDMYCFYMKMLGSFCGGDFVQMCADWQSKLSDISKRGSGDDMSIAGIVDREALPNVMGRFQNEIKLREEQLDLEKQATAEKKKKWLAQLQSAKQMRTSSETDKGSLGSIVSKIRDAIVGSNEAGAKEETKGIENDENDSLFDIHDDIADANTVLLSDEDPSSFQTSRLSKAPLSIDNILESNDTICFLSPDTGIQQQLETSSTGKDMERDIMDTLAEEIEPELSRLLDRALPVIRNATSSPEEAENLLLNTIRGVLSHKSTFSDP